MREYYWGEPTVSCRFYCTKLSVQQNPAPDRWQSKLQVSESFWKSWCWFQSVCLNCFCSHFEMNAEWVQVFLPENLVICPTLEHIHRLSCRPKAWDCQLSRGRFSSSGRFKVFVTTFSLTNFFSADSQQQERNVRLNVNQIGTLPVKPCMHTSSQGTSAATCTRTHGRRWDHKPQYRAHVDSYHNSHCFASEAFGGWKCSDIQRCYHQSCWQGGSQTDLIWTDDVRMSKRGGKGVSDASVATFTAVQWRAWKLILKYIKGSLNKSINATGINTHFCFSF